MPQITPGQILDRNDVTLPDATSRSFWLNGSAWEYPDFENAETFVKRLVQKSIVNTVEAGYFDRAHLTRSLKYRIGNDRVDQDFSTHGR